VAGLKPREITVRVLQQRTEGSEFLENLLEMSLDQNALAPADRRLAQELTYGLVRWRATLDWLIARKTKDRPQTERVQLLLRLGLYQMFWLDRIPSYAAVNETVALAKSLGLAAKAGFLNAVLRAYDREREGTRCLLNDLKQQQPDVGYSHPHWLYARWQQRWGQAATTAFMEWNNTPPPTYARVNRLKVEPANLLSQWATEGVTAKPRAWNWTGEGLVFELEAHPPLASLPSFQQGLFYVQDPSTLLAVTVLDPQPGDRVLDLCAAPGGKTTLIAQCMKNQGSVVAFDRQPERLRRVRENGQRLGVLCLETVGQLDRLDAAAMSPKPEETPRPVSPPDTLPPRQAGAVFDRVLVDAPCSNTGVMRRRIELRWRIKPAEVNRLRQSQLELLQQAAEHVKPGGILVYSTCSVEPEENGDVVNAFLAGSQGFSLETERTLLPFVERVDGAYVAKLRRTG
jgi:16S rRNA (cytosine967-C5)-methyltransferase